MKDIKKKIKEKLTEANEMIVLFGKLKVGDIIALPDYPKLRFVKADWNKAIEITEIPRKTIETITNDTKVIFYPKARITVK